MNFALPAQNVVPTTNNVQDATAAAVAASLNGTQTVNAANAYTEANNALQQGNAVVVQLAPNAPANAVSAIAGVAGVTKVTYVP